MEIIIALVIIGVGLIWYYNNKAEEKSIQDAKNAEAAPYKVEAPVEAAPAETKPAKAKKAPAKKAAKPKAEKAKAAPKAKKPKA